MAIHTLEEAIAHDYGLLVWRETKDAERVVGLEVGGGREMG